MLIILLFTGIIKMDNNNNNNNIREGYSCSMERALNAGTLKLWQVKDVVEGAILKAIKKEVL